MLFKFDFNIIVPSTPRPSSELSFLQVSPLEPCMHLSSPHACHLPHFFHPPCYHSQNIWWEDQITKLLMLFSTAPVTFSYFGPNILLSTLYWTPYAYALFVIWETRFHTHTRQAKL